MALAARRGLTLGKFAPLHRGHQSLIETALGETDELLILVYDCPETIHVPLNVRANWIRTLYPAARVVEAWDGPCEVGESEAVKKVHEDYILNRLGIRSVTHFYSAEFYGEHMSKALGAVDRRLDRTTGGMRISGTEIRKDPYALRKFLSPVVYRDLVANVVFLGAPCTGKTTIAERLAQEYQTAWMPEYGREYWEKNQMGRRLSEDQLVDLAEEHLRREDALLLEANRFLFTDTNAVTTCVFSEHYHGHAHPRLRQWAQNASSRYDLVFVCADDIPFDNTWDRSGEADRRVFQKRVLADLSTRKTPCFVLRGTLEERVAQVKRMLDRFQKYMNVGELFASCAATAPGTRVEAREHTER